ncbi:serine/threonine-protein kinase [Roseateles chitinivorans]|uniref:serine/threonine-protein kinase n=1 Tax=Roseateles chitinivorans TaxID=2917965 RepID=UPI003D671532
MSGSDPGSGTGTGTGGKAARATPHIGKYLVRGKLGEGAMGVVYRAFDPHIQREVAIKLIRRQVEDAEEAAREDSTSARFRNEARAVGRIAHPGVVTIHDFGEVTSADGLKGYAFLVMELVDGRGLDQILRREMPTPPLAWSLGVMDQLLDALASAHAQGVWHRDIKPGNLLVTRDGRVKLTDFGIARIADHHLTQAASQIGTPGYMAPEQILGGAIDHRADLFACGVLLYRLATGRMPFSGALEAVMYQTLHQAPPAPTSLRPGELPAALDALVRRAMARDPGERFPDATAMRAALAAIAREVPGDGTFEPTLPVGGGTGAGTGAGTGSGSGTGSRTAAGSGTAAGSRTGTRTAGGLDATLIAQIERALASHIGPLARHLVSRDLARHGGGDIDTLSRSLARHLADEPERAQFLAATDALVAAANKAPGV